MAAKGKLTDRERAFVFAYVGPARGNATQAAILSGYSKATARQQGSRLLTKVHIREAVERHLAREERRAIANADDVDTFLTTVMQSKAAMLKNRIAAARELNRVMGRHSVKVQHEGRVTLEQVLTRSRVVEAEQV